MRHDRKKTGWSAAVNAHSGHSATLCLFTSMWNAAAETLLEAEQAIALVGRASPSNAAEQLSRFARAYDLGDERKLQLPARPPLDLSATRRALSRLAERAVTLGVYGALHAARALELELEARLAENLDQPGFHLLAAERFPAPSGELAAACDAFVEAAVALAPVATERPHRSDDRADSGSLVRRLERAARELSLPLRVEVRSGQFATAATGEGFVAVRPFVQLSAAVSERITLHELLGHALPRARARTQPLTFLRAGSAGASDDEEGRALLVERRARLLDDERRRELAFRHRAALAVRAGASRFELVQLLLGLGAERDSAFEIALRAARGGGLARELVYLPAYFEVERALAREPELERWLERGRLSLSAARLFASGGLDADVLGSDPFAQSSTSTGA
jgi:hypothetical protein